MKKINLVFLVLGMLLFTGCAKVEPGYVGIKVNNYGDQKGVEDFPLQTGRVHYNPFTTNVYKFPTFTQRAIWTKNSTEGSKNNDELWFQTSGGANIAVDITFAYQFEADQVPTLFLEFRRSAEELTNTILRDKVRESFAARAGHWDPLEIMTDGRAAFVAEVHDLLQESLPEGIHVTQLAVIDVRPGGKVQEAIDAAFRAQQIARQKENELAQVQADAQKSIAAARGDSLSAVIRAAGEAEANRLLSKSITADIVKYKSIEKWDGILPRVSGDAVPFISVDNK